MNPQKCPQCNLMNFATAISCSRCGYLFQEVKKPMPPIRPGATAANLNSHAGALANAKVSPPANSPKPNVNYQHPLAKNNLPTVQQNSNLQQPPKPPQNQFQQKMPPTSTQAGGVMGNTVEKKLAMANVIEEANSAGLVVKILMLPFTVLRQIAGFAYSHKKVAALLLAPPAIGVAVGPNLLEAIKSANENSAIATIKVINQAQATFLTTKQRCGELKELEQAQLVDANVGSGVKSGYVFTVSKNLDGCEIYAKPKVIEGLTSTGNRSFYFSSRDNTLRVSEDKNIVASAVSSPMDVNGATKEVERPKIASSK